MNIFTQDHTSHKHFQAMKQASFTKINLLITFTNSKLHLSFIWILICRLNSQTSALTVDYL